MADAVYPSYCDPTKTVTRDQWAVTLVCNSQRSGQDASVSGSNHAVILIETVKKNGELFRQILHLTGPDSGQKGGEVAFLGKCCFLGMGRVGQVKISNRHIAEPNYTHKSETWLRDADTVRAMRKRDITESCG